MGHPHEQYAVGRFFYREGYLYKGEMVEGHKHNFAHNTECLKGALRITKVVDGEKITEVLIPTSRPYEVAAGVVHELEGLVDQTLYRCCYSHREPHQPDLLADTYNGWMKAYE